MKHLPLIGRIAACVAATMAWPALAADAARPLPEIYRATLPCLAHVFQMPTGERRDPFNDLFRDKPAPRAKTEPTKTLESRRELPNGLGLIWGDGSLVLTAEFLVTNGSPEELTRREFVLEAADGRRLEARLQAIDRSSGIALLKTQAPLGPACRFGDSSALEVGQAVVAIGNVRGLRLLMSAGIVSALGPTDPFELSGGEPAIMTTTASGPGMAGGPLLDLQGRVIGMHQAMLVGNQGAEGVSVALPIQRALAAADELLRHGKVQRSRLGLQAEDERLPVGKAALLEARRTPIIGSLLAGSPAERAGLREGDRLIAIDGQPLADTADLRRRVNATRPGTTLRVEFERDGARRTVSITTEAASGD
ncbi:S1C family serine protease [Roseateles asaccharophilus]|uniref:S1-C subfamily serine protease n=1 Tax=Roseateles asaccharophilus TaxID=582607 RepID=A0ABU2A6W9_9BURK|nr:S1C family serine protease [Roseateles asaccharophilus]MDR7332947.1 S1-C subfamily serine protease [Roseateles asaccharophilus]